MRQPVLERALFVDLEYLCWEDEIPVDRYREIVQIGVVEVKFYSFTPADGSQHVSKIAIREETRSSNLWVRPMGTIPPEFTQLTGITEDTVKVKCSKGSHFPDVFAHLMKTYGKKKVYYTWGYEDEEVVKENLARHEMDDPQLSFIDFGAVFHHLYGLEKTISLKAALAMYDLPFSGSEHDALNDAYNLSFLFQMVRKQIWLSDL